MAFLNIIEDEKITIVGTFKNVKIKKVSYTFGVAIEDGDWPEKACAVVRQEVESRFRPIMKTAVAICQKEAKEIASTYDAMLDPTSKKFDGNAVTVAEAKALQSQCVDHIKKLAQSLFEHLQEACCSVYDDNFEDIQAAVLKNAKERIKKAKAKTAGKVMLKVGVVVAAPVAIVVGAATSATGMDAGAGIAVAAASGKALVTTAKSLATDCNDMKNAINSVKDDLKNLEKEVKNSGKAKEREYAGLDATKRQKAMIKYYKTINSVEKIRTNVGKLEKYETALLDKLPKVSKQILDWEAKCRALIAEVNQNDDARKRHGGVPTKDVSAALDKKIKEGCGASHTEIAEARVSIKSAQRKIEKIETLRDKVSTLLGQLDRGQPLALSGAQSAASTAASSASDIASTMGSVSKTVKGAVETVQNLG